MTSKSKSQVPFIQKHGRSQKFLIFWLEEMQYARHADLKFLEANYIPSDFVPDYCCRESKKQIKGAEEFFFKKYSDKERDVIWQNKNRG